MNTLAIETSSSVGSLALRRDGRVLEELYLPAIGRRATRMLLPEMIRFLGRHGLRPRDLNLIGVSVGPGAFTGLRVGVTCAKTLAWATDRPLVAVDSLLAIARNIPASPLVAVVLDAQRQGVLVGRYQRDTDGRQRRLEPIRLVARGELPDHIPNRARLTGPGLAGLDADWLAGRPIAPRPLWLPRASAVASLAEEQFAQGDVADPHSLEPRYARRSAAEEQWIAAGK